MSMETTWYKIEGYDGIYDISAEGVIRLNETIRYKNRYNKVIPVRLKSKIMHVNYNNAGYAFTILTDKNGKTTRHFIHHLLGRFIDNPENKPQLNHIDGNKKNNRLDNLEWCSSKENVRHYWEMKNKPFHMIDIKTDSVIGTYKIQSEVQDIYPEITPHRVNRILKTGKGTTSKNKYTFRWAE